MKLKEKGGRVGREVREITNKEDGAEGERKRIGGVGVGGIGTSQQRKKCIFIYIYGGTAGHYYILIAYAF